MIKQPCSWLLFVLFLGTSYTALAQQIDILHLEVIQQGDSLAMMYAVTDSTTPGLDTAQPVLPTTKVRTNTWVYVVLNAPLDSNQLAVSISKNQHNSYTFSFEADESEWAEASGDGARRTYAYRFHLGILKMKKGRRTLRVGLKDPQGVELTHTSKPF